MENIGHGYRHVAFGNERGETPERICNMIRFSPKVKLYRADGTVEVLSYRDFAKKHYVAKERLAAVLSWNTDENTPSKIKAYIELGVPLTTVIHRSSHSHTEFDKADVIPTVEVEQHPDIWHRCPKCGRILNDLCFDHGGENCGYCSGLEEFPCGFADYVERFTGVERAIIHADGTISTEDTGTLLYTGGYFTHGPVEICSTYEDADNFCSSSTMLADPDVELVPVLVCDMNYFPAVYQIAVFAKCEIDQHPDDWKKDPCGLYTYNKKIDFTF